MVVLLLPMPLCIMRIRSKALAVKAKKLDMVEISALEIPLSFNVLVMLFRKLLILLQSGVQVTQQLMIFQPFVLLVEVMQSEKKVRQSGVAQVA